MMLSKYHRNAIITGYIDSYCLVCESHLRSEEDINGHIVKPIHSKNLDATSYLEKHKDDCVRKVKKGYFCEFCNILLSTAAKVGLHVVEEKHITNKGTQLLRRVGNNIAFYNILINEKAWNGLIDETCAICNTEFDNERIHKTETSHILNLVQNKVEFGSDKSIYRMIDEGSYQCLTCNMVLGISKLTTHFDESEHKKLYQECVQASIDLNVNVKPAKDVVKDKTQVAQEQKPKVAVPEKATPVKEEVKKPTPLDLAPKKPDIKQVTAKREVPVATAKKQESPLKKPTSPTEVTKKIETPTETKKLERVKLEKVTQDLDEQICKALDAKDYITHDENGKKWCLLCDWTMDSVVIHNHVYGRHHQTMLKLHKERIQNRKKSREIAEAENPKVEKAEKAEKEEIPLEQENKSKILDSVSQYQKNDVNINFECNTAVCKKCMKYLEFDPKIIEAHIEEHKKAPLKKEAVKPAPITSNQKVEDARKTQPVNIQKSDDKKAQVKRNEEEKPGSRASSVASNKETDEEIEKFAKTHDLAYNRRDSKVYCRVCDSRIPSSLKNMKEHVAGLHHKNKVAKFNVVQNTKVPSTIKKPMKEFIKNIVAVENGLMKDVIINERYCINIYSFMMITCVERFRCEPCDVNLSLGQLDDHKGSLGHQRAMCETEIIASTNLSSEFIREVRPEVFHCGYCNIVASDEALQVHLNSASHREAKTAGGWRLQQYLPDLMQHQRRQELDMFLLLKMLAGDLFC